MKHLGIDDKRVEYRDLPAAGFRNWNIDDCLPNIRCPLLNVVASNDVIAPRPTTSAILGLVSSTDKAELVVKGGHVGIVVGKAAATDLWPKVGAWLAARDA